MPHTTWLNQLLEHILESLDGRRVLLASGWADLGAPDSTDEIFQLEPVPHDWLFPRCSILIHHCGAGTAHAAARSATPSIPVPIGVDQPFWADRLSQLGVASRALSPRNVTPAIVRNTIAEVTQERTRQACTRIAEQLQMRGRAPRHSQPDHRPRIAHEPDGEHLIIAVEDGRGFTVLDASRAAHFAGRSISTTPVDTDITAALALICRARQPSELALRLLSSAASCLDSGY